MPVIYALGKYTNESFFYFFFHAHVLKNKTMKTADRELKLGKAAGITLDNYADTQTHWAKQPGEGAPRTDTHTHT